MSIIVADKSKAKSTHYPTAVEWWDSLGNVPLDRIVFDPVPGTATEADVLRLDDHEDRICELVDGTLVEKAMGYEESLIAAVIISLLQNHCRPRKLGLVSGEAGMMKILNRRVRIPDVAFVSKKKLPGGKIPTKPIPRLAPDLAVEIISESNTAREMTIKLGEYFKAGTRLVWYVDPKSRTIEVFRSPKKCERLTIQDTLDGGDVLPGFSVAISEIFDLS